MYKTIHAGRLAVICLALALLCASPCAWGAGAKEAIAEQNKKFEEAFAKRDAAAIAEQYGNDAQCLYDGQDIIRGKKAIEEAWKEILSSPAKKVKIQTLEVDEHGDWAVETGKYTMIDADGKVIFDGKYMVIWKRDGDGWKIHRDMGNSNRPK
jgi:uncharacterized protein (TIGR02246 family)